MKNLINQKVKVISLARTLERRKIFKENNPNLSYEFIDAVDGKKIDNNIMKNPLFFENNNLLETEGAYGCALSHLILWEDVIESGQAMTIAEDDAVFRDDFLVVAENIISKIDEEWDLIMWGWNFDSILCMWPMGEISKIVVLSDQNSLRMKLDEFRKSSYAVSINRLERAFGTPAYSISPKGAEKLKLLCFPFKNEYVNFPLFEKPFPINGIDIALNAHYPSTHSYVSFPPMVVTPNYTDISTVQKNY